MGTQEIRAELPEYAGVPQFKQSMILAHGGDFLTSKFNNSGYIILPGFCDVHVHFREPGFSYKETIASGSLAAAHGGYTDVCTMPNLKPVPDSLEHLKEQLDIIQKDACIGVHPYGAITIGQAGEKLADIEDMAPYAVAFSDDGKGVQSEELMKEAMKRVQRAGRLIAAHCEDNALLNGGYIHAGDYAKAHGHKGICSESEWVQIKRDIELVKETSCSYHVCHISCKESVDLIRRAKAGGVDITCETAPHYLIMDDSELEEDGRFKMNPPIRGKADKEALIEGIADGTIDMISTDHAPHSAEEKSKGLAGSAFGIVGLETAFSAIYTHLVKKNIISLTRAVELFAVNSRRRFNIPFGDDFTVWDLNKEFTVDPFRFISKGKSTPLEGMKLFGECVMTVRGDRIVWDGSESSL